MRFKKLRIDNYKSFQYPVEINFPDVTSGKSIYLIGGMVGAGKSSLMEAISYCLYGCKATEIFNCINRQEIAKSNTLVSFELTILTDTDSELIIKRSWSASQTIDPKPKDMVERLVVIQDGKRVSVQSNDLWNNYLKATIPQSITQFFFFDGEKIQDIASDEHSEVRLKSSLEAALGIEYINTLSNDIVDLKVREKKGFVPISDADIEYKNAEIRIDKSKIDKKNKELTDINNDLSDSLENLNETKDRFQKIFHSEPETRETIRKQEAKKAQIVAQRNQLELEIKKLCEDILPIGLCGVLFDELREQIEKERETLLSEIIKDNANVLAEKIVVAVNEPEPIYKEMLSIDKQNELVLRISKLLKDEYSEDKIIKILHLSERDVSRILQMLSDIEKSEVFLITPKIEEKREKDSNVKLIDHILSNGSSSESEKELFDQLQLEIEGYSTLMGRLKEQKRTLEEDISIIEKRIKQSEAELDRLYETHNVSKEKSEYIEECDKIMDLLNKFIVILRKNKVYHLQEKTFEMYQRLSSRGDQVKNMIINDKTYEIKITDTNGHDVRKSSLSAGEKEVFAISLLWGLAQTSQLKLPIIIDTPLSRLDSTHRISIVTKYFPNAGDQVIVLSTDTEIDKGYYNMLKPYLSGSACIQYDSIQKLSIFKEGYFWEENNG